jgi:hypothetical protein
VKDNKPYLIVVGALLLLTVLIIVLKKSFWVKDTEFAIKDPGKVTKIVMEDKYRTLVLKKNDNEWIVNNKYTVRPSAIRFFLETLSRIKIKSPVSEVKFTEDLKNSDSNIVEVQVFNRVKRLKKYKVFKLSTNQYGNYMRIGGNSKPYIVNLPGYSGNVGSFYITYENFWRSYTIFQYYPDEIASIKVEHISKSGLSFLITQDSSNRYNLYSLPDQTSINEFDSAAVARYLTYFNNVKFDSWILEMNQEKRDSLFSSDPQYIISLTDTQGKLFYIKIFPILIEDQETQSGRNQIYDLNRVYSQVNENKYPVVFKYVVIDPILKDINYFLPKDNY